MNGDTAERPQSLAATLGLVAAVLACVTLLLAMAFLLVIGNIAVQIGSAFQQALSSPEFQEQLAVIMAVYAVAAALVLAWQYFASFFEAPDAAAVASSLIDGSISLF